MFICTSLYDEINRQARKLPPEGLKKYYHLPDVVEDETYYFTKLLNPSKVSKVTSFIIFEYLLGFGIVFTLLLIDGFKDVFLCVSFYI